MFTSIKLGTTAFLAVLLFSIPVAAVEEAPVEPAKQCADLVKECFAKTGIEQSNCLFSAKEHPFCEGTTLGRLVHRRWLMSPVRLAGDEAPGLLGPQLIDQNCLSSFDSRLLSTLLGEEYSTEQLEQLDEDLQKCVSDIANSLTRP